MDYFLFSLYSFVKSFRFFRKFFLIFVFLCKINACYELNIKLSVKCLNLAIRKYIDDFNDFFLKIILLDKKN